MNSEQVSLESIHHHHHLIVFLIDFVLSFAVSTPARTGLIISTNIQMIQHKSTFITTHKMLIMDTAHFVNETGKLHCIVDLISE